MEDNLDLMSPIPLEQELFVSMLRAYYDMYPFMLLYGLPPCSIAELGSFDLKLVGGTIYLFEELMASIINCIKEPLMSDFCGESIVVGNMLKISMANSNKSQLIELFNKLVEPEQGGGGKINGLQNEEFNLFKILNSNNTSQSGGGKWRDLTQPELKTWYNTLKEQHEIPDPEPTTKNAYVQVLQGWFGEDTPEGTMVVAGEAAGAMQRRPIFNVVARPNTGQNDPEARMTATEMTTTPVTATSILALPAEQTVRGLGALAKATVLKQQHSALALVSDQQFRTKFTQGLRDVANLCTRDQPLIINNSVAISNEIVKSMNQNRDPNLSRICKGKVQLSLQCQQVLIACSKFIRRDPTIQGAIARRDERMGELNDAFYGILTLLAIKLAGGYTIVVGFKQATELWNNARHFAAAQRYQADYERQLRAYEQHKATLNEQKRIAEEARIAKINEPARRLEEGNKAWWNRWSKGGLLDRAGMVGTSLVDGVSGLVGGVFGAVGGVVGGAGGGVVTGFKQGWYGPSHLANLPALVNPPNYMTGLPPLPPLPGDIGSNLRFQAESVAGMAGFGATAGCLAFLGIYVLRRLGITCSARRKAKRKTSTHNRFIGVLAEYTAVSSVQGKLGTVEQELLHFAEVSEKAGTDASALQEISDVVARLGITSTENISRALGDKASAAVTTQLGFTASQSMSEVLGLLPLEERKKVAAALFECARVVDTDVETISREMYDSLLTVNARERAQIAEAKAKALEAAAAMRVATSRATALVYNTAVDAASMATSATGAILATGGALVSATGQLLPGAIGKGLNIAGRGVTGAASGLVSAGAALRGAMAAEAPEVINQRLGDRLRALWMANISVNEGFYDTELEDLPPKNIGRGAVLTGENTDLYEIFKRAYALERQHPGRGRGYLEAQMTLSNLGNLPDPEQHETLAIQTARAARQQPGPGGPAAPLQLGNAAEPGGGAAARPGGSPPLAANAGGGHRKRKNRTRKHKKAKRLGKRGTRKY